MTRFPHNALDWVGNVKVILDSKETLEPEERDLMMQLSPLYNEYKLSQIRSVLWQAFHNNLIQQQEYLIAILSSIKM